MPAPNVPGYARGGRIARVLNRCLPAAGLAVCMLVSACGSGDLPLDQVDPGAAPANPTWTQVFAIFQRECVACHTTGDPPGAKRPDLATCDAIIANETVILRDILVDNRMPPGAWPRLSEVEKLTIKRWFADGAPAPCN